MRFQLHTLILILILILTLAVAGLAVADTAKRPSPAAPRPAGATFDSAVRPILTRTCSNCHNEALASGGLNVALVSTPGSIVESREAWERILEKLRDGEMPPADQKMVFQGLTAGELCRQFKDPTKNGGKKTLKEAMHHLEADPLVLWGWDPGNGRTPPPISHAEFMKNINEWVSNGGACPE